MRLWEVPWWLSRLGICPCHGYGFDRCYGAGSKPGPGTSMCHRCGQNREKNQRANMRLGLPGAGGPMTVGVAASPETGAGTRGVRSSGLGPRPPCPEEGNHRDEQARAFLLSAPRHKSGGHPFNTTASGLLQTHLSRDPMNACWKLPPVLQDDDSQRLRRPRGVLRAGGAAEGWALPGDEQMGRAPSGAFGFLTLGHA